MNEMESGGLMGHMILGFHVGAMLMIVSGIFYFICAIFLWKVWRREKNELIGALFAFLVYQAFGMLFMGIEMQSMVMLYGNIAAFAIFLGSAYMLKFPFSSFSAVTRRILFLLSLIIAMSLFTWFMQTAERQMSLMHFVLYYDIVVNGVVVGGSIILFGLRSTVRWQKIKALGGGSGVVSCCVVSNVTMLSGALLISSIFQFLAPVLILGSIIVARKNQNS